MLRRIVLATLALALFTAAPALAHTDLESSSPKNGQTLSAAPARIALTFGEDLLTGGDRLAAKDDAGTPVELGPSTVEGPVLSAAWPAEADAGTYTVSYRAVADDGHPLEGRIRFTVQSQATPSPVSAPTAEGPAPEASSSNPWIIAAPVLLVAALAIGGLVVWRNRA